MPDVDSESIEEIADEEAVEEAVAVQAPVTDHDIEEAYSNRSFRVIYQSNNFFLPQIKDLINEREVINIRPEYQRRLRWSQKKKSLLIESLLLNIPIPPIFLYESDLARYEVMDGQQRLNAVHDYLENNYALIGLEKLSFLNGRRYNRLPPKLRRGLDRSSISAIVLLQETKGDQEDPYLVRRYVFERLNTGGEKLNPQEIRNSIYRGPFNDLIVSLTRDEIFCEAFGIPKYTETDESEYYENPERQKNNLYKRMSDCQIVLRFFALSSDENIRGAMRSILDRCMERNKDASEEKLAEFREAFQQTIRLAYEVFDGEPFLLLPDDKGNRRVSVPLYDAVMVALYRRNEKRQAILGQKQLIKDGVENLLHENLDLVVGRANTAGAIRERITAVELIVDNVT